MTGFGDARYQDERLTAAVEVRTVNNRYLKVNTKCADVYAALEADIERIIRESIARGTVSVSIRVDRVRGDEDYILNPAAIQSYWNQLKSAAREAQAPTPDDIGALLNLPGVVEDDARRSVDIEADWQILLNLLNQALQKLQIFRIEEGKSMARELEGQAQIIAGRLDGVTAVAPQVVSEYRVKMLERVRQALADSGVPVAEADLIREVSIFADRSDINEEIVRLRSHLGQFKAFIEEKTSTGRKLDFLVQEMFRETNTIGSKANNVAIAHAVVDMKAAVEKMREVLQNVE